MYFSNNFNILQLSSCSVQLWPFEELSKSSLIYYDEKSVPLTLAPTFEKQYQNSVVPLFLQSLYPHHIEKTFTLTPTWENNSLQGTQLLYSQHNLI